MLPSGTCSVRRCALRHREVELACSFGLAVGCWVVIFVCADPVTTLEDGPRAVSCVSNCPCCGGQIGASAAVVDLSEKHQHRDQGEQCADRAHGMFILHLRGASQLGPIRS